MNNKIIDVGILTWHYYSNVGSALQAYAIYQSIKELGYSCEFINYRKFRHENKIYCITRCLLSVIDKIMPNLLPEALKFRTFQFRKKYFQESKLIRNEEELKKTNNNYKCFVCGSDQIWAPNVYDDVYFLSFVEKTYKFSYAASVGLNKIPAYLIDKYKENLERLNRISVRERQSKELLENITHRKIEAVLDPTFLLNKEDWMELINRRSKNERYIFCYFLGESEDVIGNIEIFAQNMKCNIIRFEPYSHNKYARKYMGPEEFLEKIYYSEYVFTDSFHGVALSINLQKNFYCFKRFNDNDELCQNSRIINILEICNLNSRLLGRNDQIIQENSILYELVNNVLDVERINSKNYLKKCLQEGTNYNG